MTTEVQRAIPDQQMAGQQPAVDTAEGPSATAPPSKAGEALKLEDNLLFLLADIANKDGEDKASSRAGRSRPREDASSGGSSDTQSRVPGGEDRRRLQARKRPAQQRAAADGEDDGEDETSEGEEEDGGEGLSDDEHQADGEGGEAGSPGEGGEGAPRPAKRPKPSKPLVALGPRKYVSSQITIAILEQEGCFNMTQVDAARHLGFGSSTVLKKVMRRLGIKQWPYRKRTSAKKITHSLEEYMRKYGDPAKVDAVLERVRMELAVYEASPTGSIPLRPELAALRQRLYKLDNKVKHEFKRDAEAPLRQCVQSLVEKTWQELQPSWMSNLAQQPPAGTAASSPAAVPPLPALPLPAPAAGADANGGVAAAAAAAAAGAGVSDATLMLAMLLAQGITVAPPFVVSQAVPALQPPGVLPADGSEGSAATQQQQQQQQVVQLPATISPEEAAKLAAARVAALAPDPPPASVAAALKPTPSLKQADEAARPVGPATEPSPEALAPQD